MPLLARMRLDRAKRCFVEHLDSLFVRRVGGGYTTAMKEKIRELLYPTAGDPIPLFCPEKNFVAIWSAKSGCTQTLLWYFGHRDFLKEQKAFDPWPHLYRTDVICASPDYYQSIRSADLSRTKWLRVIRDPFKRAVSSYQQALLNGYHDASMSAFLGRPVDAASGYSFREYVSWLEQANPAILNPHERPQRHALEDWVQPHVVVLEKGDLWQALREFEEINDIEPMSTANAAMLQAEAQRISDIHHSTRGPVANGDEIRFSRGAKPAIWPSYSDMLATSGRKALE
ncbi:hypothetical protein, partial [Mesorhizobium marinum]|uniref:hypothetical protein n=1 Tax=Mesorhizobium marinum TaxID=3228790 RepID=UPI0034652933